MVTLLISRVTPKGTTRMSQKTAWSRMEQKKAGGSKKEYEGAG
jgi:hypothetical protein